MRENYFFKSIVTSMLLLLLLAGNSWSALAQTEVHITNVPRDAGTFPGVRNIAPDTDNNIIAAFYLSVNNDVPATLTSLTVTTAGNYQVADLKANGFKLWHGHGSRNVYSLRGATQIATKAVVASGGNLVFSGLSQNINAFDGNVIYITADLATGATVGRNINLAATPVTNFVFAGGRMASGSSLNPTSVQTIGTPLPYISISGFNRGGSNISPGSTNNELFPFMIDVSDADAILNSITIPTRGNFTAADIATNGFKLLYYYYDPVTGRQEEEETIIASAAAVSAGGNIVFSGLNKTLPKGFLHSFELLVNLSNTATPGRTIGTAEIPYNNFVFAQKQNSFGTSRTNEGNLSTITIPNISIASNGPVAGNVSPGATNHIIYKLEISASEGSAAFSQLQVTTGGTYQTSDITSFKLYAGDEEGGRVYFDALLSTATPVASGGTLTFNLNGATVEEDESVTVLVVADIAPNAVVNRTINIQPVTPANITAIAGNVTGTTTAGGVQTIVLPNIALTATGPAAGVIAPGGYGTLHTVKVDVTGAPASFNSATFQLSGNYSPSDFEWIGLVYHKNPNPLTEFNSDDETFFLISAAPSIPAPGQALTFTFDINEEETFSTIPEGSGYISVIGELKTTAQLGKTIQATSAGLSGYSFGAGNKTGTTGTGGVQTIGNPTITVSAVNTPAANVSPLAMVPVYKIKVDAANAPAVLESLSLTTAGTYEVGGSSRDVDYFELYASDDATFNEDEDNYLDDKSALSSGSTLVFDDLEEDLVLPGVPRYYILVARFSSSARAGKTINIAAVPGASAFTFRAGSATGTFPLAAGGTQTVVTPTVTVTFPGVAASNIQAGTNNNLIQSFAVTSANAAAYVSAIQLEMLGTYQLSDLGEAGFKLWFNKTNSFLGSQLLREYGDITPNIPTGVQTDAPMIAAGSTGYFFITVDLAASATASRTIRLKVQEINVAGIAPTVTNNTGNLHTITAGTPVPTITVTVPAMTPATAATGSTNNVLYRFNVAAATANATLNYIEMDADGSFALSDLAPNGFKLWRNSTDTYTGSTLVATLPVNTEGEFISTSLNNVVINSGSTAYFFVTADIAATAVPNRTISIEEFYLGFLSGNPSIPYRMGPTLTINQPCVAPAKPTISANGMVLTAASTTTGVTGYQWYRNNTIINGATSATYTATQGGDYTVIVSVGSCTSAPSDATILADPCTTPAKPMIAVNGMVLTATSTSTGITGYQWSRNGTAIQGATAQTYTATQGGNYTVVVSVGTCTSVASDAATLADPCTAPAKPTVTVNGVTLTATSSTAGVTYQWYFNNTSISGATAATYTATQSGDYTVEAKSGSCTSVKSDVAAVTVPQPCTTPAKPTIAVNGMVLTANSTTTGITGYQWSRNNTVITGATSQTYTATQGGNYTVVVNVGTCASAASDATTLAEPCTAPAKPTITVNGATLIANSTTTGITGYQWYLNGIAITTGGTSQNYAVTQNGNYTVEVLVGTCKSPLSDPQPVTISGIKDDLIATGINIYPNPTAETVSIKLEGLKGSKATVSLVSLVGAILQEQNFVIRNGNLDTKLQLKGLASGNYILRIATDKGTTQRLLVVIK